MVENPFYWFPETSKKSTDLILKFLKRPEVEFAPIAVNHGIYLAQKLHDIEMEKNFYNIL